MAALILWRRPDSCLCGRGPSRRGDGSRTTEHQEGPQSPCRLPRKAEALACGGPGSSCFLPAAQTWPPRKEALPSAERDALASSPAESRSAFSPSPTPAASSVGTALGRPWADPPSPSCPPSCPLCPASSHLPLVIILPLTLELPDLLCSAQPWGLDHACAGPSTLKHIHAAPKRPESWVLCCEILTPQLTPTQTWGGDWKGQAPGSAEVRYLEETRGPQSLLASIHTGCSAPTSRAPGSGRWLWVPGGALADKEGARWDQGTGVSWRH